MLSVAAVLSLPALPIRLRAGSDEAALVCFYSLVCVALLTQQEGQADDVAWIAAQSHAVFSFRRREFEAELLLHMHVAGVTYRLNYVRNDHSGGNFGDVEVVCRSVLVAWDAFFLTAITLLDIQCLHRESILDFLKSAFARLGARLSHEFRGRKGDETSTFSKF